MIGCIYCTFIDCWCTKEISISGDIFGGQYTSIDMNERKYSSIFIFFLVRLIAGQNTQQQKTINDQLRNSSKLAWDMINSYNNGKVVHNNNNNYNNNGTIFHHQSFKIRDQNRFFSINGIRFEKRPKSVAISIDREKFIDRGNNPFPIFNFDAEDLDDQPKYTDIDRKTLYSFLKFNSSNFLRRFLSIEKPPSLRDQKPKYPSNRNNRHHKMAIKQLVKSTFRPNGTMPSGMINPLLTTAEKDGGHFLSRNIIRYMYKYSTCPVFYHWKHLNVRFWPRYVKVGQCHEFESDQNEPKNKISCSIPAGMSCQPAAVKETSILRWICTSSGGHKGRKCRWTEMLYPILTSCKCRT
uniref:Uncharacterized protein n=1 Tax=Romanomermis culicivorax TaxID=13658 RepID=A0A915I9G7_ROMCU